MIKDEILVRYFSGRATESDKQTVEAFKQSSLQEFDLLRQIWTNRGQIELKSFNKEQAWKKIAASTFEQKTKVRRLFAYRVVAAVVALLISASIWFLISDNQNSWETYTAIDTPIVLPDGTKVWLNDTSTLKVPLKFSGGIRLVYLSGEAFFDVAERTEQPFTIDNEQLEIKVLGTSFNVLPDQVTVTTGRVAVKAMIGRDSIILSAGETAKLEGQKLVSPAVDPNYQAWRTGIFQFENTPIQEVIETLNRYYDQPLVLIDGSSDCQVNINFNKENRSTVIESLEIICAIKLK
ncbi:MAG: FecR domain-containing protein [Bacteroidota bacterium]